MREEKSRCGRFYQCRERVTNLSFIHYRPTACRATPPQSMEQVTVACAALPRAECALPNNERLRFLAGKQAVGSKYTG